MKSELSLTPAPVALLLIAAAIGVAIWAYTTRYRVLTPRRRNILLAARLLSLVALLIASLAPVARFPTASKERNRLLVLVDHSGSMEVTDAPAGRSRASAADSAAAALARELSGRYDVRVAPFDAALGPFSRGAASLKAGSAPSGSRAPADSRGPASRSPAARSGETALGDALRQATTRIDPDSVAAVVVLSDGAVNRGEDPERALDPSLPAFALVVGSPDDPPTVGIAGVEAPIEAVLGRASALHVTIRQGKRPSAKGTLRLSEGSRELSRAPFALTGPGSSSRVSLPYAPSASGKHFLSVTIDPIPGDPMNENKSRLVAVEVRPAKRLVPVLAATWDWDLRSLTRGIEADTGWAAIRLVPAGAGAAQSSAGNSMPLAAHLENASAVVARYDPRTFTAERADALLRYVERGGGLLLWIDPDGHLPAETPLSRALGLTWRFWSRDPGQSATADLTPAGRVHEVTLLDGDAASAAAAWRELPPVKPPVMIGTRGDALAPILAARIEDAQVPLLLAGRLGAGRVLVLNAAGVYRWGITASGLGSAGGVETALFGGFARWLAAAADDRVVRITAPDITPEGRSIALRLTTSTPVGAGAKATVRARPLRGGASAAASLVAAEPGVYTGALAVPPGVYLLTGRVERGGRLLGTDSTRVAVGAQGIEFESLAAEPDVLARLADRSGGTSAPLARPEPVLSRLESPDLVRSRLAQVDLFHNPLLFVVLVLGLAVEWTLRRRFNLM